MKFLQELNESRMYRRLSQLNGKTIDSIGERLFEHLLALQILVNEDMLYAKKYADIIMSQQNFTGFRTSQPDLYNLISVILNQDKYSHIVEPNPDVIIPELRLKRNLRDIAAGRFDNNDFSQLMLMLQRRLEKLPGQLIQLRRQISEWNRNPDREKYIVIHRMMQQMRERGMQSDLYYRLQSLEKKYI